jgi:hypothetical protein
LLVLLERIPRHVAIVFTTTTEGQEGEYPAALEAEVRGRFTAAMVAHS